MGTVNCLEAKASSKVLHHGAYRASTELGAEAAVGAHILVGWHGSNLHLEHGHGIAVNAVTVGVLLAAIAGGGTLLADGGARSSHVEVGHEVGLLAIAAQGHHILGWVAREALLAA